VPERPPNFVLFVTDQEQAAITAPGHPCETPAADRFASEAVRFTQARCPTAHCCPSRTTLLTGLMPSRHDVWNNVSNATALTLGPARGTRMFSQDLRDAGYDLVYTGKWHVSAIEGPDDRGWEALEVHAGPGRRPTGIDGYRSGRRGHAASDARHPGTIRRPGWGDALLYAAHETGPAGFEGTGDGRVVTAALSALERLATASRPWCLFIGTTGPHDPYLAPSTFLHRYAVEDVALPPSFGDDLSTRPRVYERVHRQYWSQLPDNEVRDAIRHYWAYCTMEDALFGLVLDALDATGQTEDTVVVRTSDHGDYAGAHGLFLKGVPAFSEAYRVPLLVRWPRGQVACGAVVEEFTSLSDIAPTILTAAGLSEEATRCSGRSLLPFLRGTTPAGWREDVHSQFSGVELYYSQRSVTTRDWKYVYNGFDFDELYDLGADPHETTNLAGDGSYEPVIADMAARMWRHAAEEDDGRLFNSYTPVALAPFGPGVAFEVAR
jgi:arylsulfatase A-like enzyme